MSVKIEISKRDLIADTKRYAISAIKSRVSNVEALGNVMTIERVYEEKLDALKTRSAPRDLFDVWYLSNILKIPYKAREVNFDKKTLVRDLRKYLPKSYWRVLDTLTVKD